MYIGPFILLFFVPLVFFVMLLGVSTHCRLWDNGYRIIATLVIATTVMISVVLCLVAGAYADIFDYSYMEKPIKLELVDVNKPQD